MTTNRPDRNFVMATLSMAKASVLLLEFCGFETKDWNMAKTVAQAEEWDRLTKGRKNDY